MGMVTHELALDRAWGCKDEGNSGSRQVGRKPEPGGRKQTQGTGGQAWTGCAGHGFAHQAETAGTS